MHCAGAPPPVASRKPRNSARRKTRQRPRGDGERASMEGSQATASTGGSSLGKYRLIAELGHGGMAEVFLAVVRGPAGFNKLMVIKQIRPQLAEDPEFLSMFL